ncbi:glutamate-1-semialdehyde 2,1-aminomutase [bacterium]|nr:glutamate-1-semialdehyde 2,1-aminomutase [bacterium]
MKHEISEKLFTEAQKHLVGGVNSPVRAFKGVGGHPLFIVRAKGSKVYDADGNEYVDYVGSWGPAILGHAHPKVITAIHYTMKDGTSFGAPTTAEIELAKKVKNAFPSMELVRFVNSGTEATMGAIRVARGFTGRDKIIKFDGCYHGHADSLLVKAGSGAQTLGQPDSAGVPADFAKHTLVADYNNINSVEKIFEAHKDQIACVIVEPIIGNMGCIPPKPDFLKNLIELAHKNGALVIFDEVMTGFRVALGGAQELYNLKPDLTCLGKIIGGGLPVGAYGGRQDIMEKVAPVGPVYQAGTLSGNPLAMAAGLATLVELEDRKAYATLEKLGAALEAGLKKVAAQHNIPLVVNRVGSMLSFFFSDKPVTDAASARNADSAFFKKVFHGLIHQGIYLAPSAFEAGFISITHTPDDIEATIFAFDQVLTQLKK